MNQKNVLLFYFKRGPNSKISHIWKAYLTLEIVKQNKYPKDNGSSILLCQAKYCVHTNVQLSLVDMLQPYYALLCDTPFINSAA
jgi:hypothetical protein